MLQEYYLARYLIEGSGSDEEPRKRRKP